MTAFSKAHALNVIRRAYGPDRAESAEDRLPDWVDLNDPDQAELLSELGLTADALFNALGAEL